jgi:two-component system, chemotaxis family, chemotaxis protein CheY
MRKRVLVVDDSLAARQEASTALEEAGFEVLLAIDGVDGMSKIATTEDLAAVVADINMPRLTGLEMLSRVKREERNAALPIIVLTTEGQPELIRQAKRAGAKGWMVKPFKPELLVALVRKFTET